MAATVHHLHPPSPLWPGFFESAIRDRKSLKQVWEASGSRQLDNLSVVPDARRAEHFLLQQLEPAVRSARLGARLKIAGDDTRRLVDDARKLLVSLRDALDDLDSRGGIAARSPAVAFRGGDKAVAAMLGR